MARRVDVYRITACYARVQRTAMRARGALEADPRFTGIVWIIEFDKNLGMFRLYGQQIDNPISKKTQEEVSALMTAMKLRKGDEYHMERTRLARREMING